MQIRIEGLIKSLKDRLLPPTPEQSASSSSWMRAPEQIYRELEQRVASEVAVQTRDAFLVEAGDGGGSPGQLPAFDQWLGLALSRGARSDAFEIYAKPPKLSPERLANELLPDALADAPSARARQLDAAWDAFVERYSAELMHALPELEFSAPSNQSASSAPTRADTAAAGSNPSLFRKREPSGADKRCLTLVST